MSIDQYTESMEPIDLVSEVNAWGTKNDVHPSHLYPYRSSAILAAIPALGDLVEDEIWHKMVETNLKAIMIARRIVKDIPTMMNNEGTIRGGSYRLADSAKEFYDSLYTTAFDAYAHWYVLGLWMK